MIIVISAPSGAGKTTIINKILSEDKRFEFVVSTTSRTRRKGEIEGGGYYFITQRKFKKMIQNDDFIEWALVHENYYGTTKKEVDRIRTIGKIPMFDVDVQGAIYLKRKLKDAVYIFIIPPSIDVLRQRLIDRKTESEEEIKLRLENVKKELNELENYEYFIVNDDIGNAVENFKAIIMAESCKDRAIAIKIRENLEFYDDNTT